MKKIISLYLAGIMALSLQAQQSDSPRNINWVHGFIGNGDSWINFDDYFKAQYNIETRRLNYPSTGGIDHAASVAIPQLITEGDRPMAIAHSMGGLVTRKMIDLGADIEGYVTFGTPHQGAFFANSYLKGDVSAFIIDFTDEVFADVLEALTAPLMISLIQQIHSLFGSEDPQLIGKLIFRFIQKYVKEKSDNETIGQLKVDSPFLKELESPVIPKINYYGVEDSPVHWRFLSSYNSETQDDEWLVQGMDHLYDAYETAFVVSSAFSATCFSWPFCWFPGTQLAGMYAGNLAGQLDQALTTLDHSEAAWLALIGGLGASHKEYYTVSEVIGWDYDHNGIYDEYDRRMRDSCQHAAIEWINPDSIRIHLDIDCSKDSTRTGDNGERRPDPCADFTELEKEVTYSYTVFEGEKSDGFIVYRATQEPNRIRWVELPHLNHQQLKSNINSRNHLEFLFRNEGLYNSNCEFFRIN